MKRPRFHLYLLEKSEAWPASGPPALSDALKMTGGPEGNRRGGRTIGRSRAVVADRGRAREGTPGVLGATPLGEEGEPKTPEAAEVREKAFSLHIKLRHRPFTDLYDKD